MHFFKCCNTTDTVTCKFYISAVLLQVAGQWSLSHLPLKILDPVPSDISVARSQLPKNITVLASEIGLRPNEVG